MFRILALIITLVATPLLAQEKDEGAGNSISPVANPLPVRAFIVEPPEDMTFSPQDWRASKDPIIPARFMWERGGWEWPADIRDWRIEDDRLAWNPLWTKPARYGQPLRETQTTDIFDQPVTTVHYEDWLPVEPSYQCDALLAMQLAIKVHRLILLPEDVRSLNSLKADVCQQKY